MATVFEQIETYKTWDDLFYSPEGRQFCDQAVSRTFELLRLRPGDEVLDAGCGVGVHSIRAAIAGYRPHALDISATAIAEAGRRSALAGVEDRITFEQADLTQLTIPDQRYSAVFSWGVLIHVPEVESALDHLARILKPGGRLALYLNQRDALEFRAERLARRITGRKLEGFTHQAMGNGYWYRGHGPKIWIWQLDTHAVTEHLERRGLRAIHRSAGAFTEIHIRLPRSAARRAEQLNLVWHRLRLPASLAVSNLLVFEKPASS